MSASSGSEGSSERTVVLVLPSETYRAASFVDAAASLGAEVVVATDHAPPLAAEMEGRFVEVDLASPEASAQRIAALARRVGVEAVVGVDDQGVLTAAHASELLGLAHNPPDAVAATRDKAELRSVLAAWDVPQPEFRIAPPGADIAALAAEVGLPCVVKPTSLSASTGVIRADSPAEAAQVAERIRSILVDHGRSADEPLLVESFIGGAEVAVEGLLVDGDLDVLAVFDKPDPLDGPYFEETIYVTPSRLDDIALNAVISTTDVACRALGLREGPVHAEVRFTAEGPGAPRVVLLEVAARSIGGLCSRVLRFGAGISLEELILRHSLGLDTADLLRADGAGGVMMLPIPRSGVLTSVEGTEEASAVDGVVGLEITAPIGRTILALPEGGTYLGFLFARGDTPEQVEATLREAHEALTLTIVDEAEPEPGAGSSEDVPPGTSSTEVMIDRTERRGAGKVVTAS